MKPTSGRRTKRSNRPRSLRRCKRCAEATDRVAVSLAAPGCGGRTTSHLQGSGRVGAISGSPFRRRLRPVEVLRARIPAASPQKPGVRAVWALSRTWGRGDEAKRARGPFVGLVPEVVAPVTAAGPGWSRGWAWKRTAPPTAASAGLASAPTMTNGARRVAKGAYLRASHCARPGDQTAQSDSPHYPSGSNLTLGALV